ncbi:MAG: hypothetical protein WEB57_13530 [Pseudohongiellaceae bacterium]
MAVQAAVKRWVARHPGRRAGLVRLLVVAGLLTGCGANTVTVEGSYPTPNIPSIPLTLGVYYGEDLTGFRYIEYNDRGNEEYIVESGPSHVTLFNTLLPSMFEEVVMLNSPTEDAGVDAVFIPSIDEFQLALPQKTRLDVYEVWVRYNMRFAEPGGETIADWVMTAYGKVEQESLRTADSSIGGATVAALRDLGSNFALGFTSVPGVNDWLQSNP